METTNNLDELNRLATELEEWKNDMLKFNLKDQTIHFSGFINGLVWAYRFNDLDGNNIDPSLFDNILIKNENRDVAEKQLKKILRNKESFHKLICWLATGYTDIGISFDSL